MTTDLLERAILLGVGLFIGFVLGYIVRSLRIMEKEVHEVCEENRRLHEKGEGGFMQVNRVLTDLLYLLILAIVLFGVWRSQQALDAAKEQAKQNDISRCESGEDVRVVQRGIVDAIYSLALGFTVRDNDDPPRTEQEKEELTAYVSSLDNFRENTYDKIKPSELCAPFVEDDNVEPEPITLSDLLEQQGETNG